MSYAQVRFTSNYLTTEIRLFRRKLMHFEIVHIVILYNDEDQQVWNRSMNCTSCLVKYESRLCHTRIGEPLVKTPA